MCIFTQKPVPAFWETRAGFFLAIAACAPGLGALSALIRTPVVTVMKGGPSGRWNFLGITSGDGPQVVCRSCQGCLGGLHGSKYCFLHGGFADRTRFPLVEGVRMVNLIWRMRPFQIAFASCTSGDPGRLLRRVLHPTEVWRCGHIEIAPVASSQNRIAGYQEL